MKTKESSSIEHKTLLIHDLFMKTSINLNSTRTQQTTNLLKKKERKKDGGLDRLKNGWMIKRMDDLMDEWIDGIEDGWMD